MHQVRFEVQMPLDMGISRLEDMDVMGSPVPALRKIATAGDSLFSPRLIAVPDHLFVMLVHFLNLPDDNQDIDNGLCEADLRHGRASDMMDFKPFVLENGSEQGFLLPVQIKPLFRPWSQFGSSQMNTPFH